MKNFLFIIKGICIVIAVVTSIALVGDTMATVEKTVNINKTEDCDVAFIGSSHIYRGINPQLIFDETGITSANIATSSQDIKGSFWLLKTYLKHHDPQVVFVEIPTWEAGARETYALWNIRDNDILKVFAYDDLKNDKFDINDASRFLAFRTEYSGINKNDFDYLKGTGYLKSDRWYNAVYSETIEITEDEVSKKYLDSDEIDVSFIYSYIDRIMDLAESNGTSLVFINTPSVTSKIQDDFYDDLKIYFADKNVSFLNFADIHSGISKFDLKSDFADNEHLSFSGGTKLTEMICDYLIDDMTLSHDESKNIDDSWIKNRKHYQYTYDLVNMNTDLLTDFMEYAEELPEDYIMMIAFDAGAYYKLPEEEKNRIRKYGIDVESAGNSCFVLMKQGNNITTSQGITSSTYYCNIDGTSFCLECQDDRTRIRCGQKIISGNSGEFLTGVYVLSYNDFIYSKSWQLD